jgi:hypothetical protein
MPYPSHMTIVSAHISEPMLKLKPELYNNIITSLKDSVCGVQLATQSILLVNCHIRFY